MIQVELPLPPVEASPNSRFHWGAKARAIRLYRETCTYLIRQATGRKRAMSGPVVIDLDFYTFRDRKKLIDDNLYRPRDEDNARASAKSAQDALVDAGVIKFDSKKYVKVGATRLHTTRKEHQNRTCLVMTIQPENERE